MLSWCKTALSTACRRYNLVFCSISSHHYVLVFCFSAVCQNHSVFQPLDYHHQKSSISPPPAICVYQAQIPIVSLLGKSSLSSNLPLQPRCPPKQDVWRHGEVTWEVTQGNWRETRVSITTTQLLSPICKSPSMDQCSLLAKSITFVCSDVALQGSRHDALQLQPTHQDAAATAIRSPRHKWVTYWNTISACANHVILTHRKMVLNLLHQQQLILGGGRRVIFSI